MTGAMRAIGLRNARLLALVIPAALLGGAWAFQLLGGLYPCEMCHWQRWPHYGALVLAVLAFVTGGTRVKATLVAGAAALIAVSGLIGVFHAGVEYHWWQGITACTQTISTTGLSTDQALRDLLAAPIVRCDAAQWALFGVSLAGWNAILSLIGAAVIATQLWRRG
ncbi:MULTISPECIES: disulfide bond formation protein B [Sphingomonas]|jgi:disulfide bond formation protein DsbB|uniref:disulfide bond formation protein B n=1 Tax=Sphingomonas TaxID=13687 RepID=UPI0009E6DE45|nr:MULTISPECIES: disulfide bond formation protein B [Sphingomonas]MBY0301358.1 disulfide bond formation protein B [Sphingomonas ginsenosidimutans]